MNTWVTETRYAMFGGKPDGAAVVLEVGIDVSCEEGLEEGLEEG